MLGDRRFASLVLLTLLLSPLPCFMPTSSPLRAATASSALRGRRAGSSRPARRSVALSAASATVAARSEPPLPLTGKVGKAGGDDGDGPTPAEQVQVVSYRLAIIFIALSWWAAYTLDFFMVSGINFIDPGLQKSILEFADLCAGLAALTVPTGSALLAGVLLRILGISAIASVLLGATGAAKAGSLLGPACVMLVCAREVFWFGLASKADAALTVLLFVVVTALRATLVVDGIAPQASTSNTGTNGRDITLLRDNELQWLSRWQELELPPYEGSVPPVGPPLLVSFLISSSTSVLAFSKVVRPIGEDLDEEGEQFFKRSSGSLTMEDEKD